MHLDITYFTPLIGLVAGLLIGTTGVGGAAFATPAMVLALGVPAPVAVATDAVFCAVIKLLGLRAHRSAFRDGQVAVKRSLAGSIPGVLLGVLTVSFVGRTIAGEAFLERSLGVLLIIAAAMSLYRAFHADADRPRSSLPSWVLPVASFVLGFVVGLTSIGAGSLFLPLLLLTVRLPFRSVVAIDIAQGLALAIVAGAAHLTFGSVNPTLLALLIAGGIPGIILGARLHGTINPRTLISTTASVLGIVGVSLMV